MKTINNQSNTMGQNLFKHGISSKQDAFGHVSFRPEGKSAYKAPKITTEYYEEELVKDPHTGATTSKMTRMYDCEPETPGGNPRTFIADKYDEMFVPSHDKRMIGAKLTGKEAAYKYKR